MINDFDKSSIQMVDWSCANCGCTQWMPQEFNEQLRKNHNTFYCINGHGNVYNKKTDIMPHKTYCQACIFMKHGVKTRQALTHTCGQSHEQLKEMMQKYKLQKEKDEEEAIYFDLLVRMSKLYNEKGYDEAFRLYPEHKDILDKLNTMK
jgi:hypothetical protein